MSPKELAELRAACQWSHFESGAMCRTHGVCFTGDMLESRGMTSNGKGHESELSDLCAAAEMACPPGPDLSTSDISDQTRKALGIEPWLAIDTANRKIATLQSHLAEAIAMLKEAQRQYNSIERGGLGEAGDACFACIYLDEEHDSDCPLIALLAKAEQ